MDSKENRQHEKPERAENRPRKGTVVQQYELFADPAEEHSNAVLAAAAAAAGGEKAAKGRVQPVYSLWPYKSQQQQHSSSSGLAC